MAQPRVNRQQETRGATKRPEGWIPPNAMPMDIDLGPDVKVRWIRKFINGAEEDKTSFFRRLQRGWTPVRPEEVPHLAHLRDGDVVMSNGCILCKIDAAIARADVQFYEDRATGALASAKGEFENTGGRDERIPKFSEGSSKVFRQKLPN